MLSQCNHIPMDSAESAPQRDAPLPSIPSLLSLQPALAAVMGNADFLIQRLPPMVIPSRTESSQPPLPSVRLNPIPGLYPLNPALFLNNQRPTHSDDAKGFGPAKLNVDKRAQGIRCFDAPVCKNDAHETNVKRINMFRVKASCRGCLQEAIRDIPDYATWMQGVRFVSALFRNYFCPFCLLEADRDTAHLVPAKFKCDKHSIINQFYKCVDHDLPWSMCKDCAFDPRAGTRFCACGALMDCRRIDCTCAPALRNMSHGIRFLVNPFVVPSPEDRARDAEYARFSLERAMVMQNCADVLKEDLPLKRTRNGVAIRRGSRLAPRLAPPSV